MMSSVIRLLLLLPVLSVLVGCSKTALLYDNADWMATRWVSTLLDPDGHQEDQWGEMFGEVLQRHRLELLPEFVSLLAELEQRADGGLSTAFLDCWLDAADGSYRRHAQLLIPTAVDVLLQLRPAQIDHLEAALEERNDEYREEMLFADPAEQREARVDRYVDRVERWTGALDVEQREWFARQVERLPDVAASWLAYRQRQQRDLVALLRSGPTATSLRDYLEAWWLRFDHRPPQLESDIASLRGRMVQLLGELDQRLAPRQRQHLAARIRDLREGLASVAGPVNPVVARDERVPCGDRLSAASAVAQTR
ncbi:MAG: hypothetical protein KDI88_04650 [Gammaproteobacteria bacterium]|nr:hypothetical protein [Gammaproteobacteria bacterium]